MIVVTLRNCPVSLRGDLSKWLLEVNTNVYVGNVSARVRDALWERICENIREGEATLVYTAANEQHMEFRVHNSKWKPVDYDGITLIKRPVQTLDHSNQQALSTGFSKASHRRHMRRKKSKEIEQFVFLDIETTGLEAHHEIIEIGVQCVVNGECTERWSKLIVPKNRIPDQIVKLTGITNEMVQSEGVLLKDALVQLMEIVAGKTVVCYNSTFDLSFLQKAYAENNLEPPFTKIIDVLPMARKEIENLNSYKLGSVAKYFGISTDAMHRALQDCDILRKVFLNLRMIQ